MPNSSGVCGNSGGTQTGWNIKWVKVAGGSELAGLGEWVNEPLKDDLITTTARAMYDHSRTRSKWFYLWAGAKGTYYSSDLLGQDDDAEAYHSSGGVSGPWARSFCIPADWNCNDLSTGSGVCEGGAAK